MACEFEHGAVLANPSLHPFAFDLAALFPGKSFRRLSGTPQQNAKMNDGARAGTEQTTGSKNALFLIRQ
jgi:hypothetical protein